MFINKIFLINNNRLSAIEGLRSLAIIFVFFFHFNPLNLKLFGGGHLGVDIFFVLSGYLIYDLIFYKKKNILPYIKDRFIRLYPLYIITLLTIWLIHYPVSKSINGFIANLFFFPLFKSNLSYFNYVSWSLGWEWVFYFLIILIFYFRFRAFIFLFCLFILLLHYKLLSFIPFFRFCAFFIGCLVSILNNNINYNINLNNPGKISFFLIIVSIFSFGYLVSFLNSSNTIIISFYLFFDILVAFLLLHLLNSKSYIIKFFSYKPFIIIGRISYSIYLTHAMLGIYFSEVLYKYFHYNILFHYIVTVLLTLLISSIFFILIERPYFTYKLKMNVT